MYSSDSPTFLERVIEEMWWLRKRFASFFRRLVFFDPVMDRTTFTTVGQYCRKLRDSNPSNRHRASNEVASLLKLSYDDERVRKAAAKFIKRLQRARDVKRALKFKSASGDGLVLYIYINTPPTALRDPLYRELSQVLNAVEWIQQITAPFTGYCGTCKSSVETCTRFPELAQCPECKNLLARWLYNSRGEPVAYLYGELAFKKTGKYLGNLEAYQIWEFEYEAEIVLDDRIYVSPAVKGARSGFSRPSQAFPIPAPPPNKTPVPEDMRPGSRLGDFEHYRDLRIP